MKQILALVVILAAGLAAEGGTPSKTTVDFEAFEVGKAPEGFSTALTGNGRPGTWVIREDSSAPSGKKVLAQTDTDDTSYRFPVCVHEKLTARDVHAGIQFKPVSGKVDQAAGIVLRYQDKDNYYIVRANALENNVRLYKIVAGRRQQFAGANTQVATGQWQSLGISLQGQHFMVMLDGKPIFEADDDAFKDAGKVGLWTKADSVTLFDDLTIEVFDKK